MSVRGIESLNHVSRMTAKLPESRRFYVDVLGFREISRPNFDFEGAWLYGYGIQIHLICATSVITDGDLNTRANHIAFSVADVDGVEQQLQAMGVEYKRKCIADRGIHQLFFRDPDGHLIELGRYNQIDQ